MTHIKITIEGNVIVMYPEGRLDLEGAELFESAIKQILKDTPGYHLLIDLKNVEYISSTCLRVLLLTKKSYADRRLQVKLCNANSICEKVFALTNMDKILDIIPTYDIALQSF